MGNRVALFLILFLQVSYGQSVYGKWKTIDDETGKEKGIVDIFEYKGKVYGRIVEIFDPTKKHLKCEKCEGDERNKPILGMNIIRGLKKNGNIYDGGKIIDPKNGKSYHCKMTLEGKDKLVVRGYIGISLFGRSQTWVRQK